MENTRGNTIREVLIQKCLWYYQFDEIMGGSPTVSPPFLMESGHANRETNTQDELYRDHDTQMYQAEAAIRQAEAEERREEAKLRTLQFEMQLAAMRNS